MAETETAAETASAVENPPPADAPQGGDAEEEEEEDDLFGDGGETAIAAAESVLDEEKKVPLEAEAETEAKKDNVENSEQDGAVASTAAPPDVPIESNETATDTRSTVPESKEEPPVSPTSQVDATQVNVVDSSKEAPSTPIPRKTKSPTKVSFTEAPKLPSSPPAKQEQSTQQRRSSISSLSSDSSGPMGFPVGVTIPPSFDRSILDHRSIAQLKTLPVDLINAALTEYDDAVAIKGNAIRSRGAYLHGVIKRYLNMQERGLQEGAQALPMGDGLTPPVQIKMDGLVASGFCTKDELNDKVRNKMRSLTEKNALLALDELGSVNRAGIRNFGSYFMGILNRWLRNDEPQPLNRNRKDTAQRRESFDRGRDRNYRDRPSSFSDRDRSRDRYDQEPSYYGNNPNPPQQRELYDARRFQQQPWQNQQQNPTNQFSYPNSSQNQPMMGMQPPGNNPYGPPPPQQQQYSAYQQQHGPPPSNQSFVPQQQPPFQQGGYPQQQQPPQQLMGHPHGQQSYPPHQQPLHQQQPQHYPPAPQQQQQHMMPPYSSANGSMHGSFPPAPAPGGFAQPSQPPMDILGLADKAASAVQALNQGKVPAPSSAAASNPSAPPSQVPPGYQQQQYGAPPGGNMMPPSNYPPVQQQPHNMPPGPQQQFGSNNMQQYQMGQQQQHRGARGKYKKNIQDLTPMVQFAVQNLEASGAVEGSLDPGMLGMLWDLPEQQALVALEKFSSLNKSSVRNRTAYLAGLLRRELETINKR